MKIGRGKPNAPAPVEAAVEYRDPHPDERALATKLVDERLVDGALVERALTNLNELSLGTTLLRQGAITDARLTKALGDLTGVERVDLREASPEPLAVELVPEEIARASCLIPLSLAEDDAVIIVFADPSAGAVERLSQQIGRPVVPRIAATADIRRAIDGSYRATSGVGTHLREFEVKDVLRQAQRQEAVAANEEAPVVQVAQMIITQALRDRASDIHIEPGDEKVRVRYRIDGALHDVLSLPESIGPALVSRIKILGGMNIVERRRPQDGQITTQIEGKDVDIRVSTTAVVGGEKVVMRVLDKSRPLFALTDLGMPDAVAERYATLLRSPYGMVICSGPTGSGKTTTLYASLSELNTPERNLMTIEDPVEYTFPTINQIQINEQAGITFAGGLKSILRQDPDVILVGEVRDAETARIAVQSALTGHFVLSSLHATDSVSALHRLLDMGIEAFLVTSAVTAVVAQRLVRRICSYCKQPSAPTNEEKAFLASIGAGIPDDAFMRGEGCNFCSHTGYLERIGIYELLTLTDAMREMILDRTSHDQFRKVAIANGLNTLQDQAVELVASGTTTVSEAMRTIFIAGA
ncbi:MAG: GspE/PulE family protein [Jatrophihabitans sp.]|uniref:GspE/PulE family protein n=1 Tax=Jatrophihabitans sp. TaxID=1932789 RepID=UPI003F814CAD